MTIRITGMNSGLDTDAIVSELVSAYKAKGDKYVKEQTKLSWKQDMWKSLNTKIFNFYKSLDNLRLGNLVSKKTTVSDASKATITAGSGAVNGTQKLKIDSLATGGYVTGGQLKKESSSESEDDKLTASSTLHDLGFEGTDGKITLTKGTWDKDTEKTTGEEIELTVSSSTTISDFVKQINDAGIGVKASFDAANQRLFITSDKTGEDTSIELTGNTDALKSLGLSEDKLIPEEQRAVNVKGGDASITLNGAKYTSSTNTFKVNGLTIQAQAETDKEISVTTDTDVQGMYDKIKNFLSDYNSLINEISGYYNADSAKGYEPLTTDEKDAMSDSEVAEWEKKIKDSLLRRDNTLSGIMSAMTSAMSTSVNVNGKDYSLSSLGIKTLGYFTSGKNEKNALHIDGDADDENTSNNTDKLMEMLTSDPEAVSDIIKGIASKLYKNLDEKMKSTTLSSAYTVYNDREMAKSYSDYTTTIKNWNKKVADIEDSYYKKFSAMETALAKLQSQMSSFTGMLG